MTSSSSIFLISIPFLTPGTNPPSSIFFIICSVIFSNSCLVLAVVFTDISYHTIPNSSAYFLNSSTSAFNGKSILFNIAINGKEYSSLCL